MPNLAEVDISGIATAVGGAVAAGIGGVVGVMSIRKGTSFFLGLLRKA